ncbi:hypothetical protein [Pseudovibrio sp. Tun.PSC04-5.I4]|uniref:hypothetical protein n=1 Tax=Pseudovibrio sp. Tun.PSC04-5.I4 TaxID=1798213 RepID=UPI00088340A7|nr:hypothetical protein [Pseudovibrio sp. Tun.PSC04-5.I4]SDR28030.1 hypothetical protein SAMN04515695_4062 [Pseudovibrio sp. Tun.PSC04-5.I4]
MLQLITGAPLWVWPLLALLIFLGIKSSKQRQTSVKTAYFLPFLGLITINGIITLPNPSLSWSAFFLVYALLAGAAYHLQKRWVLARDGDQVTLAGEWFTLCILMTQFVINYASKAINAVNPDLYTNPVFLIAFASVIGATSGTFLGRALCIIRG